jgi:hypothetical protein
MKTLKQLREEYKVLFEKEEVEDKRFTTLVRAGLFDMKKLPILKRALEKDSRAMTPAEKNTLIALLDSLLHQVTSSSQVYNKVKQNVAVNEVVDFLNKNDPRLKTNSTTNIPSVLILRRKAIRRYPDDQTIALYYVPALDKYVSIPFDSFTSPSPITVVNEQTAFDMYMAAKRDRLKKVQDEIRTNGTTSTTTQNIPGGTRTVTTSSGTIKGPKTQNDVIANRVSQGHNQFDTEKPTPSVTPVPRPQTTARPATTPVPRPEPTARPAAQTTTSRPQTDNSSVDDPVMQRMRNRQAELRNAVKNSPNRTTSTETIPGGTKTTTTSSTTIKGPALGSRISGGQTKPSPKPQVAAQTSSPSIEDRATRAKVSDAPVAKSAPTPIPRPQPNAKPAPQTTAPSQNDAIKNRVSGAFNDVPTATSETKRKAQANLAQQTKTVGQTTVASRNNKPVYDNTDKENNVANARRDPEKRRETEKTFRQRQETQRKIQAQLPSGVGAMSTAPNNMAAITKTATEYVRNAKKAKRETELDKNPERVKIKQRALDAERAAAWKRDITDAGEGIAATVNQGVNNFVKYGSLGILNKHSIAGAGGAAWNALTKGTVTNVVKDYVRIRDNDKKVSDTINSYSPGGTAIGGLLGAGAGLASSLPKVGGLLTSLGTNAVDLLARTLGATVGHGKDKEKEKEPVIQQPNDNTSDTNAKVHSHTPGANAKSIDVLRTRQDNRIKQQDAHLRTLAYRRRNIKRPKGTVSPESQSFTESINLDGHKIYINNNIKNKLVEVYDSLSKDRQQKMLTMLTESEESYNKVISFITRQ